MTGNRMLYRLAFILILLLGLVVTISSCSSENVTESEAKPIMELSADSVMFTAKAGQGNPARQQIAVFNRGIGPMTTVVSSTADWISERALNGRDVDSVIISVTTSRVLGGTTIDSVKVSSPEAINSPQYLKVIFTVGRTITAEPTSLFFSGVSGGSSLSQDLGVLVQGGGNMAYTVRSTAPWLTLSKLSGTAPDSIRITAEPGGLTVGTHTDTLVISSSEASNDSIIVEVSLAISSWVLSNGGDISVSHTLQGIHFLNNSVVWTVGSILNSSEHTGVAFRSIDGGVNWTNMHTLPAAEFGGISFANDTLGCIVGDSAMILRTIDGGTNWIRVNSVPLDSTKKLGSISFVGNDSIWVCGESGSILHSSDGGITWSAQTSPSSLALNDISFVDNLNGWMAGDGGTILRTTNGGQSWNEQVVPTIASDLRSVSFVSQDSGWVVGRNGIVLRTTDGGNIWTSINIGSSSILEGISFSNSSKGWLVGRGKTLMHSEDGGATWIQQFLPLNTDTTLWLFDIQFVNDSLGLVIGEQGSIYRTSRGGF